MAFQSLYRRYRPRTFDELVGQAHVSTALRNAVREGRVGHAYLFSGPRGTGKTSTARILAKAINCSERGEGGEPCGACPSCADIAAGTSLDVVELDAASNNGVAEIRALLERVAFRTAGGARRVYIVDEVHMLSTGAANALLKTLEEPPEHVVFVLATTDPYKVLPTIRSRTQHFEFTLVPDDALAGHLRAVLDREGVEADDDALALVAHRGAGSVRDSLSFLDQVLAHGGARVDLPTVELVSGGSSAERRAAIVDAIAESDPPAALVALESLVNAGIEPRHIADDLLRHLRDTFLLAASRGRVAPQVPEHERARLAAHGERMGAAAVTRAIEVLGDAVIEMRRAPDPRLVLEVALVRLARADLDRSVDALAERVAKLERALTDLGAQSPRSASAPAGEPAPSVPVTSPPSTLPGSGPAIAAAGSSPAGPRRAQEALRRAASPPPSDPPAQAEPERPPAEPHAAPVSEGAGTSSPGLDDVILAWPAVLAAMTPRLRAMAQEAQPSRIESDTLVLVLPDRFAKVHKVTIEKEQAAIAALLASQIGSAKAFRLRVELEASAPATRLLGDEAGASGAAPEDGAPDGASHDPEDDLDATSAVIEVTESTLDSVERMLAETFDAQVEDDVVP